MQRDDLFNEKAGSAPAPANNDEPKAAALSNATVAALPATVQRPAYDRDSITTGIVHIGPSHFARGHIFKFIDDVLARDPRWGVTAISLKSATVRDTLAPQDNLYTITEQSEGDDHVRVIGSLKKIIVAPETPDAALEALADPNVKLVTLTVTQTGYHYTIRANDGAPADDATTTIDLLVKALQTRKDRGAPPLTIMSCDNLPGNGVITRNAVLAVAASKSPELRQYVEDTARFPSTMVDRIVPSTTSANIAASSAHGIDDKWPVYTEKFCQWVIENNFAGDMPDLASAGAQITDNFYSYELMKIRMLNGGHLGAGFAGKLAGHTYIHEAMQDPAVAKFVSSFMKETAATLAPIEGVNYDDYRDSLIQRFRNPKMRDELTRLARNATTDKLRQRALDPAADAIGRGLAYDHLAFATAAWIEYLKGVDSKGQAFDILDEKAVNSGLQAIARNSNGSANAVVSASGLFSSALETHAKFQDAIQRHLRNIQTVGIAGAIDQIGKDAGQPAPGRKPQI